MSPAIYLPVMPTFKKHVYGWWNNKSPFKYPYAFASYLSHNMFKKLRSEFEIDSDVVLFSDSGGYSIFARGVIIDPYELAEWYNSSGVDLAIHLDYPPYKDPKKSTVIDFDERLELTVRSSKILLDRVKSTKLYSTIHGNSEKHYDRWRSAMELVSDNWFGWALGVAPINDPNAVLKLIRYLELIKNDKPVHFFETGDVICFLLIARYANKRGLLVTSDSNSPLASAQIGMQYITIFGRNVSIGARQEDATKSQLKCLCPVCSKGNVQEDIELLTLHNAYMLIWRYEFLNSISCERVEVIKQVIPEAVGYIQRLDAILEKRGSLLSYD
jgi:tRNA-guanine family transglycosylase